MNVAEEIIASMRERLDLLLYSCYRYMKQHDPDKFRTECAVCKLHTASEEINNPRCGMELSEVLRIVSMLRGVGLTDCYQPKKAPPYKLRNRFGRLVCKKVKGK